MKLSLILPKLRRQQFFSNLLSWGIWAIATFPLIVLVYIGTFVRYVGDDYSTSSIVKSIGFWSSQIYWYQTWTGSFTYTFLTSFLGLLGVSAVAWLQAICLIFWVALLFFALDYSFRNLGLILDRKWIAILASITIFVAINSFQDYSQLIFWQTGIIAYLSNCLIFTAIILYFARKFYLYAIQPLKLSEMISLFFVILICGGICETWIIMQTVLFILGASVIFLIKEINIRKNFIKLITVGIIASIAAFLITFLAPGNASRDKGFFSFSFAWVIKSLFLSFIDVFTLLREWVQGRTLLVVILFAAGILAGYLASSRQDHIPENQNRSIFLCLIASLIMLWMGLFPGFYVIGARPQDRSIFTGMFVFIFGLVLTFAYIGYRLNKFFTQKSTQVFKLFLYFSLMLLMAFSPLRTAIAFIKLIPTFKHYAQVWDQRDLFLRQAKSAGQKDVVIFTFKDNPDFRDIRKTILIIGDMEPNPSDWVNQAAAVYYGLDSIAAETVKR